MNWRKIKLKRDTFSRDKWPSFTLFDKKRSLYGKSCCNACMIYKKEVKNLSTGLNREWCNSHRNLSTSVNTYRAISENDVCKKGLLFTFERSICEMDPFLLPFLQILRLDCFKWFDKLFYFCLTVVNRGVGNWDLFIDTQMPRSNNSQRFVYLNYFKN